MWIPTLNLRVDGWSRQHGEWALADMAVQYMGHTEKVFSSCTMNCSSPYPQLMNLTELPRTEPQSYERHIRSGESGFSVIRRREENASLTLVGGQDTIGSFSYGEARLISIRPTLGFFGKAVIKPLGWEVAGDSYQAVTKLVAPYFGPLTPEEMAALPADINVLDMYNSCREEIDVCDVTTQLRITPVAYGFNLHWQTDAKWPVYAQLALMFGSEGYFQDELG